MAMLPAQAPSEQGPIEQIRPTLAGSRRRSLAGRSDESLVAIAKEGDERAFEILYERHAPAILRYCRSLLRSTQEAEDVKQEAFVLAISALRRGAQPDAFRPWLYRVAHNACMSHLRVRRPVLVADNGVLVGPAGTAEPFDGHREELRQLLDDIGNLPDVQRGALLLREMDGFSYEQVGEVLGLPLSTVRASIFRARRTLQGLAEARDADCEEIQSELSRLADRRGRRGRHITTHLHVCATCRDFRDGLRRRPAILGGVQPAAPFGSGGLLLALKGKLFGGSGAGGAGAALATAGGGGAGVAKIAAVAASSIALLAGAGVEADRVIDHSHREATAAKRLVATVTTARAAAPRTTAGGATATTAGASAVVAGAAAPLREGRIVGGRPGTVVRTPVGARPHAGATHGSRRPAPTGGHGAVRATGPAPGAPTTSRSGATTAERDGDASSRSGDRDDERGTGTGHRHHASRDGGQGSSGSGGSSESGSSSRGTTRGHTADPSDDAVSRPDAADDAGVPPGASDDTPSSPPHLGGPGTPTQTVPAPAPSPGSGTPPPSGGTTTPAPAPTPAAPVDPASLETAPADPGTTGTTTTTASPGPGATVVSAP